MTVTAAKYPAGAVPVASWDAGQEKRPGDPYKPRPALWSFRKTGDRRWKNMRSSERPFCATPVDLRARSDLTHLQQASPMSSSVVPGHLLILLLSSPLCNGIRRATTAIYVSTHISLFTQLVRPATSSTCPSSHEFSDVHGLVVTPPSTHHAPPPPAVTSSLVSTDFHSH